MLEIHKDLISLLSPYTNPVIWAVAVLLPGSTSISWKRKYLAPECQDPSEFSTGPVHAPPSSIWQDETSRNPPPLSTSASSPGWCNGYLMDRCERLCMSRRGTRWGWNSSLSVLLPAAALTDLEEQVKRYPSACLQPLALVLALSAYSWVQMHMHFSEGRYRKTKPGWWWDRGGGSPLLVRKEFDSTRTLTEAYMKPLYISVRLFFWCSRTLEKWPL